MNNVLLLDVGEFQYFPSVFLTYVILKVLLIRGVSVHMLDFQYENQCALENQ